MALPTSPSTMQSSEDPFIKLWEIEEIYIFSLTYYHANLLHCIYYYLLSIRKLNTEVFFTIESH